jgi:TRAP-type uncharacterized transport system substrate-binding protein
MNLKRRHSGARKTAILIAVPAVIGLLIALHGWIPNLWSYRLRILSGSPRGNYHAIVDRLAEEARRRGGGQIENLSSAGSVQNVERLAAAAAAGGRSRGEAQFALVQDGMEWPAGQHLELIGRIGSPESFVLLGREADRLRTFADLRGKRIGIGPAGSGTERVSRQLLAQLPDLQLHIYTLEVDAQIDQLARGELDLGAMVIDENAQLLTEAIRDRGLQMVNIIDAEVLARRLPFARAGVIRAGTYDPVRRWPSEDKHVIQIDMLLIGNGRASWSATQRLITTLLTEFPDFVRRNREQSNRTGLPMAPAARAYFDNDGPDIVGVYVPWLVDLMPTARWVQLIFALSILFNVMAFWHRFRLWRLDVARVRLESDLPLLFGPGVTRGEIAGMSPAEDHQHDAETRAGVDRLIERSRRLLDRCRAQSQSPLVPMGQEMGYRYQEMLIVEMLYGLRKFREKLEGRSRAAATDPGERLEKLTGLHSADTVSTEPVSNSVRG